MAAALVRAALQRVGCSAAGAAPTYRLLRSRRRAPIGGPARRRPGLEARRQLCSGPSRRQAVPDASLRPVKILVVDADPQIGSHLAHLLDEVGYVPVVAQDAGTAAQLFDEEWAALVIIDVMLGLDLLRTFRYQRDIPIIVLSGMASEEARLQGLEAGADDYVSKPYSTHELLARIRARLRRAYAFPFEEHEKCS
jgi:CheY-like chemotaxis protein